MINDEQYAGDVCVLIAGKLYKKNTIIDMPVVDSRGKFVGKVCDLISMFDGAFSGMSIMMEEQGRTLPISEVVWMLIDVDPPHLKYGVRAKVLLSTAYISAIEGIIRLSMPVDVVKKEWVEIFV